ncbi:putative cysteine desulfurase [Tritonibacter multivorans]|uniref:Putative cysteine desulfurase n=1 Tax=Tritonibacter multivorans TaxID=928856 RepID=A0A0P1GQX3_9RHOB|nr:aminotransferase class V-fold PLP-dependent enzyme [Tritonibacter multivorans]MDA7421147.1 aminotransferase class V-fold PLP-dependent enzyme [Tritonibacter multivorans]CUH77629.1 putative cysteine desulfurase [Tritonibacter multivorans]SFD34771.1 Selenocysteine lyase/Cysteine desulfurase [Tritonibacter multivorans]
MHTDPSEPTQFHRFAQSVERPDLIAWLQQGLIGDGASVPSPTGAQPLIYADYVASGRALQQIEDCVTRDILPYYANSHTEASFCGQMMTRLRKQARQIILKSCKADDRYALVFTGSGATAGLNRLVGLFGACSDQGAQPPLVILGPYEHHSNILPWRESGAEVVETPESPLGGPDLDALEEILQANHGRHMIGAFSAMSNVTGIVTDVPAVTRLLKRYGALSIWDYAGGAPYLDIDMSGGTDAEIDAIVLSAHKFIGGPGASGVLILRRDAVSRKTPTLPGGGTVSFVSPWAHDYSDDVVAREEAGTPNVIGDLRAALCFMVKDAIGSDFMQKRLATFRDRAEAVWLKTPGLTLLGNLRATRVPIFSFVVKDLEGRPIHQQLVTRMLTDLHGVQARGGCACAGPYGHRLLGIDAAQSDTFRQAILNGQEIEKPGWTRLGFSALMCDEKADRIIEAVASIAGTTPEVLASYRVDEGTARFSPWAA